MVAQSPHDERQNCVLLTRFACSGFSATRDCLALRWRQLEDSLEPVLAPAPAATAALPLSVGSADVASTADLGADPPCNRTSQYDALTRLYNELHGSLWHADQRNNWLNRLVPLNEWKGITCSGGVVTGILISLGGISDMYGTITSFVGLGSLRSLTLAKIRFVGHVLSAQTDATCFNRAVCCAGSRRAT